MLLTRRALLLLLLTAPLLALGTVELLMLDVAIGYLVLVVVMILADRALSPKPAQFTLARRNDPRLSLGAENRVVVRVENNSRRTVRAIARDEFPPQFRADRILLTSPSPQEQANDMVLKPRVPVELIYHVNPPRRGDYGFGDLNLRWWGFWG